MKGKNKMTKNLLIAEIAKKTSLTKKQADEALEALISTIEDSLAAGDKVQITGFGSFEVRERGEHSGRNPYTGEPIVIAASKHPAFVAGKNLKDKVK